MVCSDGEIEHRITVIKEKVQDVPVSQFARLEPNDILFVDSTHIMKAGSDVNYELFHILPALNDGVLIHFHDIHYPFAYPESWLYQLNFSWNEAYALRAFLMLQPPLPGRVHDRSLRAAIPRAHHGDVIPTFLHHPGGSVW